MKYQIGDKVVDAVQFTGPDSFDDMPADFKAKIQVGYHKHKFKLNGKDIPVNAWIVKSSANSFSIVNPVRFESDYTPMSDLTPGPSPRVEVKE